MRLKILFVERKFKEFFSLEKVFRQIADSLPKSEFETAFQQTGHHNDLVGTFKNLASFKPKKADIYHITGHITYIALVMPSRNTVLTIPDLGILYMRTGFRRSMLKKLLFDWPVAKSRYITAISQTTKDEVVKYTGCDASKVRVIEIPLDENLSAGEKEEFNADCPKILQIGTAPHKNLANVIKAIHGIKCELIIIGRLDEQAIASLKQANISYRNEFEVGDDVIRELYRTADLVVFCSLFEGFGLPIIEAQAMKTPVVTSDIDPMREVAGGAALLVDPHDPGQIREAIQKVIGDRSVREKLVAGGLENIKRYHHERVAEKYADLYREIVANNEL